MKIFSVVIPVYNSGKTIGPLCRRLAGILGPPGAFEIILVNDGSADNTDEVCRTLATEFSHIITYIQLTRNFGEHNAVMAGLHYVRGEYAVIMDDDFQNPPEEVPKLFAEIQSGYDVVYCRYPERKHNIFRRLGSYVNGKMADIAIGKPHDLYLSSFKAINRFMVDNIIKYDGPYPYIDAIIIRTTRNIGVIEVSQALRKEGHSNYTFTKLMALWGNMMVGYSLVPVRLLGLLGLIFTVMGLYQSVQDIIHSIDPLMNSPTDIEELQSITTFFRGFQLLAISLVGEYTGRIYLSLNREPQYIVRNQMLADRRVVAAHPQKRITADDTNDSHAG